MEALLGVKAIPWLARFDVAGARRAGWSLPWPSARNAFFDRIVSLNLDLKQD
jgi:hypothetical protein